jgi:hypothetical protein
MSDAPSTPPPNTPWYKNYKTVAAYAGLITALCSGYGTLHNLRTKSSETKVDTVYAKLLDSNLLLSEAVEKTQAQLYELRQYVDNRDDEVRSAATEQRATSTVPVPKVDKPKPIVRRTATRSVPSPTVAAAASASPPSVPPAPSVRPAPPSPELVLPDKVSE